MEKLIIIKGDVSGIQEFIFNVKSKGAAKTLKARSFFIDAIGILGEEYIKKEFPNIQRIYNGGGNFYLKLKIKDWNISKFQEIQKYFLEYFKQLNISLNLSYIEYDSNNYGETIANLNEITNNYKLTKWNNINNSFFEPFIKIDSYAQEKFKAFSETFIKSNYYTIENDENLKKVYPEWVEKDSISLFGKKLLLQNNDSKNYHKLYSALPIWTSILKKRYKEVDSQLNSIIDFGSLADFAKNRTGTRKIAALKLDIDNLGSLFRSIENEEDNKKLSKYITTFFTENFYELLKSNFYYKIKNKDNRGKILQNVLYLDINGRNRKIKVNQIKTINESYKDNLYVVFAGGDDSFIIGAWDAVIHFAVDLRNKFKEFDEKVIRANISQINKPITFSAAILIVDEHFPIVKIAQMVEERLHQAKKNIDISKNDATGKPMKNNISFLNRVFTWEEFDKVADIQEAFWQMIVKYNENRAFLQKIQQIFENKDTLYWQRNNKPYDPSVLWRFKYHFREIIKQDYFIYYFKQKIFGRNGIYQNEIWDKYNIKYSSKQKVPVAARWTELLTKNL